jgi:hypothetical protein
MATTANVKTSGEKNSQASGNNGSVNLMKPYEPNLINIPASNTEPATGAST